MTAGAQISPCGTYRYKLWRSWSLLIPSDEALFVMLNPSTADGDQDDPTIRRCIGFAKAWGCEGLMVANLYALRSTDPSAIRHHPDPVGPLNDELLAEMVRHRDIVCAWGANAPAERVAEFVALVAENGGRLWSLATTKTGQPRHPLYLRKDAELRQWTPPSGNDGS